MRKTMLSLLACGLSLPGAALAEEIRDTFVCVTQDINVCKIFEGCRELHPIEVNAPNFWKIELKKKQLTVRTHDGAYDTTEIDRQERVGDMILIQSFEEEPDNFEEALAWSVAVNAMTGRMSASVSAHEEVVSLLGTCHAL
mgnify:FL=1